MNRRGWIASVISLLSYAGFRRPTVRDITEQLQAECDDAFYTALPSDIMGIQTITIKAGFPTVLPNGWEVTQVDPSVSTYAAIRLAKSITDSKAAAREIGRKGAENLTKQVRQCGARSLVFVRQMSPQISLVEHEGKMCVYGYHDFGVEGAT